MTKFEQELRRMFDHDAVFPHTRFVGNACYGRLTDQIRVKICFQTGRIADQYDRLNVTLLNRNEGVIDSMVLKFQDIWGRKKSATRTSGRGFCTPLERWECCGLVCVPSDRSGLPEAGRCGKNLP